MKKHTLLIVEDHTLLRETWKMILDAQPQFNVIGTTGSGVEAVHLSEVLQPAVVIMDIQLQDMDGIRATAAIKKANPAIHILCVSFHNSPEYVKRIMAAGALGYLSKNASQQELISALLMVAQGQRYLSSEIKNILVDKALSGTKGDKSIPSLSDREHQIIEFIKNGASSKEIAAALGLSVKTIEVHRYNILRKLQLKNTAALVDYMSRR